MVTIAHTAMATALPASLVAVMGASRLVRIIMVSSVVTEIQWITDIRVMLAAHMVTTVAALTAVAAWGVEQVMEIIMAEQQVVADRRSDGIPVTAVRLRSETNAPVQPTSVLLAQ